MDRGQFFQLCLPVFDRLWEIHAQRFGRYPVFVMGPTHSELGRHAPALQQGTLDDPPSVSVFPVLNGTSIREIVESHFHWRKFKWYGHSKLVFVAIPPSVELTADIPKSRKDFDEFSRAFQLIALLELDRHENEIVGVVADLSESLCNSEVAEFIRDKFENLLERLEAHSYESHRDLDEVLRKLSSIQAGEDPEATHVAQASNDELLWPRPDAAFRPEFLWRIKDDSESMEIALLGLSTTFESFFGVGYETRCTHLRHVVVGEDVDTVVQVMLGNGPRKEADLFVPWQELLRENWWNITRDDIRDAARRIVQQMGFAIRRVGELASIELIEKHKITVSSGSFVWMVAEGRESGRVCTTRNQLPDNTQILQLRCDEHHFLAALLHDRTIRQSLRLRADGPYERPDLSVGVVSDTYVPWPSPTQRDQLLEAISRTKDIAVSIIDVAHSLANVAENVVERVDSSEILEFNFAEDKLSVFQTHVAKLTQAVMFDLIVRKDALSEFEPSIIAVPERQLKNKSHPAARLELLLEIGELWAKHDATVLLSCLGKLDPSVARSVCKKVLKRKQSPMLAFGDWNQLASESRRRLRDLAANLRVAPIIGQMCEGVRAADHLQELVRIRNSVDHGGGTLSDGQRSDYCDSIEGLLRKLSQCLLYHRRLLVFVVERTKRLRSSGLRASRLMLVRDNTEFERQIDVECSSDVNDGEIYGALSDAEWVSLYPWQIFVQKQCGDRKEVPWILDGIKNSAAVYKSPLAAGETLHLAEHYDAAADVFSL